MSATNPNADTPLQTFQPLSPRALAVAFAALGLFASIFMAMPFGWGPGMMYGRYGGPYGGPYAYGPHPGWGFGFFGLIWVVAVAAAGGAIVAWVYNAMIGPRTERARTSLQQPS